MEEKNKELESWIESNSGLDCLWYAKRLAGNDTLLTGGHQAGPYVPKGAVFNLFPSLKSSRTLNPRIILPVVVNSHHSQENRIQVIYYNNGVVANGTRDECRLTGWGGSSSPILNPESTGSLCIFAFHKRTGRDAKFCNIWLCTSPSEEDFLESHIEPVEPGEWIFFSWEKLKTVDQSKKMKAVSLCKLDKRDVPQEWSQSFPSAAGIVEKSISLTPSLLTLPPDKRLLERRACEFEVFKTIESLDVLPRIKEGFSTVTEFIDYANSVGNRRKSRAGRSLELHTKGIFIEENLSEFSHGEKSEGNKKPDFLFPSAHLYHDKRFPAEKLRMLAAKTTCKDRWRQICNEADRIGNKHLLTLQEGVSKNQFEEMEKAGVTLVVPSPLHQLYPREIRHKLLGLGEFITEMKRLYQ